MLGDDLARAVRGALEAIRARNECQKDALTRNRRAKAALVGSEDVEWASLGRRAHLDQAEVAFEGPASTPQR